MVAADYIAQANGLAAEYDELTRRFRELRANVQANAPQLIKHRTDYAFSDADAAGSFADYLGRPCGCPACKS